jgi:cardiolipin synthase
VSVGSYAARDLLNAPTLISLTRLPLAAAFTQTLSSTALSLLVLGAAAFSDVLDGFVARRFDLATPTGAVVDGLTDKAFAATVLVTLVLAGRLMAVDVALLGTRELVELPLVGWLALSPAARSWRKIDNRANVLGKAATILQFATVAAVIGRHDVHLTGLVLTATVGAAAGVSYWRRALSSVRRS